MCGPLIAWIASIFGAFALGCLCAGLLAHRDVEDRTLEERQWAARIEREYGMFDWSKDDPELWGTTK